MRAPETREYMADSPSFPGHGSARDRFDASRTRMDGPHGGARIGGPGHGDRRAGTPAAALQRRRLPVQLAVRAPSSRASRVRDQLPEAFFHADLRIEAQLGA